MSRCRSRTGSADATTNPAASGAPPSSPGGSAPSGNRNLIRAWAWFLSPGVPGVGTGADSMPLELRNSHPRRVGRSVGSGPGNRRSGWPGGLRGSAAAPLPNVGGGRYGAGMLRPESWSRLTGESPVRVGTGAPGSRPRFVVERRRAERGVKSHFGGSKRAGCSVKRTLQPRHSDNGEAEPLMSRRRPRPSGPVPGSACRVPPGQGGWHARTVWAGTGEARLPGLRRAKTAGISRW